LTNVQKISFITSASERHAEQLPRNNKNIQTAAGQALYELLTTTGTKINSHIMPRLRSVDGSFKQLKDYMRSLWVATTHRSRARLLKLFMQWTRRECLPMTANSAVLFLSAHKASPQAVLNYTKAMSGTFVALGWDNKPLLVFMRALQAQGAAIPKRQARAMSKQQLLQAVSMLPRSMAAAAMIAWKSAARIGEVKDLTRANLIQLTEKTIIIDWFTLPKGRRGDPYTPSRYAVLEGDLVPEIYKYFRTLPKDQKVLSSSTTQFRKALQACPGMRKFSAHSIKRGAISHLMQFVPETVEHLLVSRLAKHKVDSDDVSRQTLRYGADHKQLARSLRTSRVTILL
jgi:hypothetical protein